MTEKCLMSIIFKQAKAEIENPDKDSRESEMAEVHSRKN